MASNRLHEGDRPTLLTLPAEIRNRIYQYALSNKQLSLVLPLGWVMFGEPIPPTHAKLAIHRPIFIDADSVEIMEFNQLKFVCRQLYAEAAGLELKYNDIAITQHYWSSEYMVSEQFRQLAEQVKAKTHWLTGVTVTLDDMSPRCGDYGHVNQYSDHFPTIAEEIARLASWCRDNASVQIDVVLSGLTLFHHCDSCLRSFMLIGVAMTRMLTNIDISDILPRQEQRDIPIIINLMTRFWLDTVDINELRAPNLRWRVGPTDFDEDAVKKQIDVIAEYRPEWKDLMEKTWVDQARRWVQQGL